MRATHSPSRSARSAGRKRVNDGATTRAGAAPAARSPGRTRAAARRAPARARARTRARRACGTSAAVVRITASTASPSVSASSAASSTRPARVATSRSSTARDEGLAAGEAPVDGGAGAAGLLGDVVEGGLGDADPGDAGKGGVEHAVRDRAGLEVEVRIMCMRQYCADRLIVSTCQASHQRSRSRAPTCGKQRRCKPTQCVGLQRPGWSGLRDDAAEQLVAHQRAHLRGILEVPATRRVDQAQDGAGEVLGRAVEVDAGPQAAGLRPRARDRGAGSRR